MGVIMKSRRLETNCQTAKLRLLTLAFLMCGRFRIPAASKLAYMAKMRVWRVAFRTVED